VNDGGTNLSGDQTFTTTSEANVVTLPAAPVSVVTATLNGVVIPNGQDTLAYFEYGTSTSYGTRTTPLLIGNGLSAVFLTNRLDSLPESSAFNYRLVATNSVGAVLGSNQVFQTLPPFQSITTGIFTGGAQGVGICLVVPGQQPLEIRADLGDAIPRVEDGPWPAFPADLMSVALVAATQSKGSVLFHEKMYESRLFFLDRLIGMGAKVVLCDPHRALVQGPARLRGEPAGIPSPDIRAGIALVIAGPLCRGPDGHSQHRADRSRLREHRGQAAQPRGPRSARVND